MIGGGFSLPTATATTGARNGGNAIGAGDGGNEYRARAATSPEQSPARNAASDGANKPDDGASAKPDSSATKAAARRDAAQDAKDAKTTGEYKDAGPSDFAALMESNASAGTTTPPPATNTDRVDAAPTATAQPGLPEQLLALLGGAWALPPAASATPAASLFDALPGATTPAALPTLANAATTANADGAGGAIAAPLTTTTTPAAAPTPDAAAFAALAALASDAAGDGGKRDLPGAIDATAAPDPTTLAATTPLLAPVRASAPPPTAAIVLPADPDAGFDDAFGGRIAWMAEQRIGHAEIRISPEHVGPIDVRVQLDGNRVSAEFHSADADVRHALEASLPRLRDLLGLHGLQLGQADVGQRHAGQHPAARRDGAASGFGGDHPGDTAPLPATGLRLRNRGLLDEYA